jgi:hypothetical protein
VIIRFLEVDLLASIYEIGRTSVVSVTGVHCASFSFVHIFRETATPVVQRKPALTFLNLVSFVAALATQESKEEVAQVTIRLIKSERKIQRTNIFFTNSLISVLSIIKTKKK